MKCFKCNNPMMDLHHVLFGQRKKKPKAWRDFLNNEYNLMPLCRRCHEHHGGYSNRELWMQYLISVYGRSAIIEWLESAPDKMKITDLWKSNRRLADFENVGANWRPENTGGK